VEALLADNAELRAENARLKALLGKDSSNSSRPPSSDSPASQAKATKARTDKNAAKRKRKARRRGGQAGHKRNERALVAVENVDEVHVVKPERCECCERRLWGKDAEPVRHQVFELPPITPHVDEWQLHALLCGHCGTTTQAQLPDGVPSGAFGPRVHALVAICGGVCRMSKRTIQGFLSDVFGLSVSLGMVSKLEQRVSESIAQPVEAAREHVRAAAVVNADETSWREAKKKAWMWLAATTMVAVFIIRDSRAATAAKELLGETFSGLLISDRYGGYNFVDSDRRQACWSHLLRDVEAFRAFGRTGERLADEIQKAARTLIRYYHRVRDGTMSRQEFRRKATRHRRAIEGAVSRGRGYSRSEISGVCKEIHKLQDALFTFVDHDGVDPTNNHAERLLRHAVIWRKLSFGTDSAKGSRFVERMLTVVMSLRMQQRNVLDYMTAACEAQLHGHAPPSLVPTARLGCAAAA
jgi:transposase